MNSKQAWAALALAGTLIGAALPSAAQTVVTFGQGNEGWTGPQGVGGATFIDPALGNAAPALHTVFEDFGITFRTTTNAAFVGDYTQSPSVTLGLDVLTQSIQFFGQNVTRRLVVELRDHDNPAEGYPYTSVWATLGTLSSANAGWQHLSVTIADTSATALPTGWGGYGAEDPVTFEPTLPPGRTFASVLAGVDELVFTTLVPGFFYGFTDFDVAIDNVSITAVPEPASALLLGLGLSFGIGGLLLHRRRAAPLERQDSMR